MGVDPRGYSLRELAWMAEARQKAQWDHTAALLALLYNAHRDPQRSSPASPLDFHPLRQRRPAAEQKTTVDIKILKRLFVEQRYE